MASRKSRTRGHRRERRKANENPGKAQKQRMGTVGHGGNGPIQAAAPKQKMAKPSPPQCAATITMKKLENDQSLCALTLARCCVHYIVNFLASQTDDSQVHEYASALNVKGNPMQAMEAAVRAAHSCGLDLGISYERIVETLAGDATDMDHSDIETLATERFGRKN